MWWFLEPFQDQYVLRSDDNFSRGLLLITLLLTIMTVGYYLLYAPSSDCGPFRNLDAVWDWVGDQLDSLPEITQNALITLTSPALTISFLVLLCVAALHYGMSNKLLRKNIKNVTQKIHKQELYKRKIVAKIASEWKKKEITK
eukprot:m.175791 g.175791  ORF g.175791 m.175791 type:complete len:143 (+) comp14624_c0_seq1:3247-3675(+)